MPSYTRIFVPAFTVLSALFFATTVQAQSPLGKWKTVSDKTGQAESIVTIYESNGVVYGNIEKLLLAEDQGKKCTKCPGQAKDKPLEGLMILWGLKKDGDGWSGGQIMDPDDGTIYSCKIRLDGNNLIVRGFVGISLLGRSQTWYRN